MQALNPVAEFAYSTRVRELFTDLKHAGVLSATPAGSAIVRVDSGSRAQGARVCLQVELVGDCAQAVRYQAYGCPHFLAACENLARWLEGRSLREVRSWSRSGQEHELEFPVHKRAKLLILEDALAKLLGGTT